jgi:hypothetical protein
MPGTFLNEIFSIDNPGVPEVFLHSGKKLKTSTASNINIIRLFLFITNPSV